MELMCEILVYANVLCYNLLELVGVINKMPINLERDFKIVRVCPWEASIDDNIDWLQLTMPPKCNCK
jgi:hypothetical protein